MKPTQLDTETNPENSESVCPSTVQAKGVAINTDALETRDPLEGSSSLSSLFSVALEGAAKRKLPNDDEDSDHKKICSSATDEPSKENSHHENDSVKPQDESLAAASHSGESKHSRTPSEEQNMYLATKVTPPQFSCSLFSENGGNEERNDNYDPSGNRASTSSSWDASRRRPSVPSPSPVTESFSSDSNSSTSSLHSDSDSSPDTSHTLVEFDRRYALASMLGDEAELNRLAEYGTSHWNHFSYGSIISDNQVIVSNRVFRLYSPPVEE